MQFKNNLKTQAATAAMCELMEEQMTEIGQQPAYQVQLEDALIDATHAPAIEFANTRQVGQELDLLTSQIVKAVYQAHNLGRFSQQEALPRGAKRYWSPAFTTARLHQQFLGTLQDITRAQGSVTSPALKKLVEKWESGLIRLYPEISNIPTEHLDHSTGHPPKWWIEAKASQKGLLVISTDYSKVI